jgi:hypothetical protein
MKTIKEMSIEQKLQSLILLILGFVAMIDYLVQR